VLYVHGQTALSLPIGSRIGYEKSIATKMNDLDLCFEVVSRSRQTLRYILPLNISETVRDRGLVPAGYQ